MRNIKGQRRDEESLRHIGVSFLSSALDCLLEAHWALSPDIREWDPPSGALSSALSDDVEAGRSSEHIREIDRRLRKLAPHLGGHLDELTRELREYEMRCATVGWTVGVQLATSRACDA